MRRNGRAGSAVIKSAGYTVFTPFVPRGQWREDVAIWTHHRTFPARLGPAPDAGVTGGGACLRSGNESQRDARYSFPLKKRATTLVNDTRA